MALNGGGGQKGQVTKLSSVTEKTKSCASADLHPNVSTSQQLQEPLQKFQGKLLLLYIPTFLGKATPARPEASVS